MTPSPTAVPSILKPLAEELLDNSYARDNLQEGAEKLRDAYSRSRKRRVKPSRDRKLRKQLEAAIAAIDEGTAALAAGRHKPAHRGRKLVLGVLAVTAAGAGVALALNEELRNSVFGSAKALGEEIASKGDSAADEVSPS
jgi:predicted transcriptional regulator